MAKKKKKEKTFAARLNIPFVHVGFVRVTVFDPIGTFCFGWVNQLVIDAAILHDFTVGADHKLGVMNKY